MNTKSKKSLKWSAIITLIIAVIIFGVGLALYCFLTTTDKKKTDSATKAAVVTNGEGCARIGTQILEKGGTAVDAAIAASFCEGLKMPQSMGIGGGFIMTIYRQSDNKADHLIARERAPFGSTTYMYNGNATRSKYGILSVAVPGEVKGYWEAYNKYGGKVPWRDLIQPSIDLCLSGIEVTAYFANVLHKKKDTIFSDLGLKSVFVNPKTNDVYQTGDKYKMPMLAETLAVIAREGGDALHNGSLTKKFVAEIQNMGGIITEADMNNYKAEWHQPITIKLPSNRTLYTAPLPASGVILGFMLNILKRLVVNSNPDDIVTNQRIVEAFKFGYGKRTQFGDLSFLSKDITELADNLTNDAYADHIRQKIFDDRTSQDPAYYGANTTLPEDHGTANIVVLAANGDAVSMTSTINLYFGSGIMLQNTGIILNDEMDDFSSPDIVNDFGLPPTINNYIQPGKRPMSSMCPTIVVKDGHVELAVGAAGGSKITTSVALIIIRNLWFNITIHKALNEKRFHHQLFPMEITFEKSYKESDHYIVDGLQKIGHKFEYGDEAGFSAATAISNSSGNISGAYDWRRQGAIDYIR